MDDVGNAIMIRPNNEEAKKIRYQPRGGLVVPKDEVALTTPQQSVASKDNPEWLESPEDMRARLRAEADENSNSTTFRSPLAGAARGKATASACLLREEQERARTSLVKWS